MQVDWQLGLGTNNANDFDALGQVGPDAMFKV
jgi:hypothetical protein